MSLQKISSKNQIVVPKEARLAMKVRGGDELLVVVKGELTILMPKPKNHAASIRGMGKGLYGAGYSKRERANW